jgi:DNA-binding NarL/FixJ family response regulator
MHSVNLITSSVLVDVGLRSVLNSGGGNQFSIETNHYFDKGERDSYDLLVICASTIKDFNIFDCVKFIKSNAAQNILVIGNPDNDNLALEILESGVNGFITDECDNDEIVQSVHSIIGGRKFFCNKALDLVMTKHLNKEETVSCDATSLSVREIEILELLGRGLSNKIVADKLHISPHTVHTHRRNIMKKLNIRSVSELTIYCVSTGIISP